MKVLFRWLKGAVHQQEEVGGLDPNVSGGSQPWHATHQHKKGGKYRLLAEAVLEVDRSDVVIYDDESGQIWVRSKDEFYDGRFTELR